MFQQIQPRQKIGVAGPAMTEIQKHQIEGFSLINTSNRSTAARSLAHQIDPLSQQITGLVMQETDQNRTELIIPHAKSNIRRLIDSCPAPSFKYWKLYKIIAKTTPLPPKFSS